MNLKAPGMRAPIVDVVFPSSDFEADLIFDRNVRKVIGALQRRFWTRRSHMLRQRALHQPTPHASSTARRDAVDVLVDLADASLDWDGRMKEFATLAGAADSIDMTRSSRIVNIRGWEVTEPGILVDGRAVPGCIVDLAVAMTHHANSLRSGLCPFVLHIPNSGDAIEERLWKDLLNVAEDRLGVERGVLQVIESGATQADAAHDVAVA